MRKLIDDKYLVDESINIIDYMTTLPFGGTSLIIKLMINDNFSITIIIYKDNITLNNKYISNFITLNECYINNNKLFGDIIITYSSHRTNFKDDVLKYSDNLNVGISQMIDILNKTNSGVAITIYKDCLQFKQDDIYRVIPIEKVKFYEIIKIFNKP